MGFMEINVLCVRIYKKKNYYEVEERLFKSQS